MKTHSQVYTQLAWQRQRFLYNQSLNMSSSRGVELTLIHMYVIADLEIRNQMAKDRDSNKLMSSSFPIPTKRQATQNTIHNLIETSPTNNLFLVCSTWAKNLAHPLRSNILLFQFFISHANPLQLHVKPNPELS